MPTKVFEKTLQRDHSQVQFRPTLYWLDSKAIAASHFEKNYQEWQVIDPGGTLILFSPEKKESLEIFTNQINFFSESTTSREGLSHVDTLMKEVVEKYSVEKIRKLISRLTLVLSSPIPFDDLTDLIHKKLYNDKNIQGGTLVDLAYVLDTNDGDMRIHTQLGAAKKEESIKNFQSKFEKDLKLDSEINLYIDVMVSIEEEKKIHKNQIAEKLKMIKEKNHKVMEDYITYLTS